MKSQLFRTTTFKAISICALVSFSFLGAEHSFAQAKAKEANTPVKPVKRAKTEKEKQAEALKKLKAEFNLPKDDAHDKWTQSALTQMRIAYRAAIRAEDYTHIVKSDPITNPTPNYYESIIENHQNAVDEWKKVFSIVLTANTDGGLQLQSRRLSLIYRMAKLTNDLADQLFVQAVEKFRPTETPTGLLYLCEPYDNACANGNFAPVYRIFRYGFDMISRYIQMDANYTHEMRRLYTYRRDYKPPRELLDRIRHYVHEQFMWFQNTFQIIGTELDGKGIKVPTLTRLYGKDVYRTILLSLLTHTEALLTGSTGDDPAIPNDPAILLFPNAFPNEVALISALRVQLENEMQGNSIYGTLDDETTFLKDNEAMIEIIKLFQQTCRL